MNTCRTRFLRNTLLTLAAAAVLLMPPSSAEASRPLEIIVSKEATVRGDTVNLGQIAVFRPSQDPRVAELKELQVASAPSPGKALRLNKRFLAYKVGSLAAAYGEEVALKAPPAVIVKRTAQVLTGERIKEIFRKHLLKSAPWDEGAMNIDVLSSPGDLALPEGDLGWEIWTNGNGDYLGNISAVATFCVDGAQVRRIPLSGRISVSGEVVQAVKPIRRGETVGPEDVDLVEVQSIKQGHQALRGLDQAIGMRALRNIRPGQTLTTRMVENPPAVRKGAPVTIVAENKILRVTTLGEALEDGWPGDRIRVRNVQSGKEITCKVQGSKHVSVTF
jgi:flagella basal body P-ring formation protein FlgA